VNRNDRWRGLPTIVLKETTKRPVLSQRKKFLVLMFKGSYLKTGSEGVEGYRLETLRESLHETVKSAPPKHGEPLDVAQSRVRSSIKDTEVGNRPLVVLWILAQAPLPSYLF
jgi:hypothetical protein